jgi:hypothetical protein
MIFTALSRALRVRSSRSLVQAGLMAGLLGGAVWPAGAQKAPADTSRQARDTVTRKVPRPAASEAPIAARGRFTPPITPRRAFVYSAIVPGLGQARLDRGSSGALFAAVELAAVVMVRRSNADLREALRYRADTLPTNFNVGPSGTLTPVERVTGRYDADLVRTRRLHVEDWLAALAFNHLFSGADAFVAAQLWDMPLRVTAAPSPNGTFVVASVRF